MQGKLALALPRARSVMRAPGNCCNLKDTVVSDLAQEIVARRARFLPNALGQANAPA